MKSRLPLLLLSLYVPLTLPAQDQGLTLPKNLDTSKGAAQLKYDLKIGTQFDTNMKIAQDMEMMGQPISTAITMGFRMDVKPGGDQGAKKAVVSYTQTGINMDMMGQKIVYDSADENDDPSNPLSIMGDIIGKEITMIMDENNEATSIEGIDELKKELAADPAMAGQLDAFIDEKQLAQMTNVWVSEVLKDTPVAPGDTWDFSYSMEASGVGEVTYKGKATLPRPREKSSRIFELALSPSNRMKGSTTQRFGSNWWKATLPGFARLPEGSSRTGPIQNTDPKSPCCLGEPSMLQGISMRPVPSSTRSRQIILTLPLPP